MGEWWPSTAHTTGSNTASLSAVRHIFATNYSVAKKRYWVEGQ
jgi:hypothetical protein